MIPVLTIVSLLFGISATAAGVMAVDRMHAMLTLTSSVSVSDVMFPFGHWLLAAVWMAVVATMVPTERRAALTRCVGIGIALHVLILVTLFVAKLGDRDAFSATVYLLYAQLFCMATVAASMVWLFGWLQRMSTGLDRLAALEAALLVGTAAVAVTLLRQNVLMGTVAMAGGAFIVALIVTAPAAMRSLAGTVRTLADNDMVFLGVVFVIAVALRLLYVQRIMGDPSYLDTGADGRVYDGLAWSIASGGGIPQSFTDRYPLLLLGYVWFLAAIYKVLGHSYFAATAVQSLLGAGACLLIYGVAQQVFDRATARVAAVFTALSFSLIFAAAALGHQALDVFVTALIAWMLLRFIRTGGHAWRWAAAGAMIGIAIAIRETTVFFAAFLLPWIAFAHPGGWRVSGQALAAFAAGAAIVVLPFVAPKVWTPEDRQAMRLHFDRLYRGQAEAKPVREDLVGPLADPKAALAQFRSEPMRVGGTLARAYAKNIAVQFLTQPYGGFDLVFLRKGTEYYYGLWFYAYALTVAGTIVAIQRIPAGGFTAIGIVLVLGLIAARTFPHIILESDYRHRVPIEPFLILLASVGAVALCREVMATAASTSTIGFTGNDWRVSHSSGT